MLVKVLAVLLSLVAQPVEAPITPVPQTKTDCVTIECHVRHEIEAQAVLAGVDVETALRIANCESRFNPDARSSISSAKGVYQFIDGTWEYYCHGDVFDYTTNIDCFMKLYPTHKSWWECK